MQILVSPEDADLLEKHKWYLNSNGYALTWVPGKPQLRLSRLVAERVLGAEAIKGREVDHINRNRADNRRENLRLCNRKGNMHNLGKSRHNSSGYKGVSKKKDRSKWDAWITIDNRRKYLGSYDTPEEASVVYQNAVSLYWEDQYIYLTERKVA